ncbi:SDR family oxidoreductase [Actinacidiphila sp. bgisy167]|uniref:SDR family oxidoreductase n=1 Tax=Actinacidiphila sp. bgisy167 TaxID=3413797 RepID=UPI003D7591F9
MKLEDSVVVVTGGNRGFGQHLVSQLIERGAKVYAAARRPETVQTPGAIPLQLDITDPESVAAAAKTASDATLLINNAGTHSRAHLMDGDFESIRHEMEVSYFGTLNVTRHFAPVIEGNGGGAILNVCSQLSWIHWPDYGAYNGAKAAEWAMTNVLRQELAPRGILVSGLYVGYMDTEMVSYAPAVLKNDPAAIATLTLDALAADEPEIVADDMTKLIKQNLPAAPGELNGKVVEILTGILSA